MLRIWPVQLQHHLHRSAKLIEVSFLLTLAHALSSDKHWVVSAGIILEAFSPNSSLHHALIFMEMYLKNMQPLINFHGDVCVNTSNFRSIC